MSQALRKLTGTTHRSKTAVIFINQIREKVGVLFGSPEVTPGGRALKFYSSVRIDLRRIETIKKGTESVAIKVRARVVKNKTADLDNAIILLDKKEKNHTYIGNGTYHILAKPGKHSVKVIAPAHKNATMEIFIPPQDDNLSLVDIEQGIDGVNRFTFEMGEGTGKINLEDTTYLKMGAWCPNLIFIFSLIGLWGAWMTYTLQSYNNAQIGAFFSVLAIGFLIIGPIIGIIALFYLKKYKFLFTASFKN